MKRRIFLHCALLSMALVGCAAPKAYVSHPDLNSQIMTSSRIGIVVGGTSCYKVIDGKTSRREDKSAVMRTCVEQGAFKAFTAKGYEVLLLTPTDRDIRRILKTYREIHSNARNHFPDGEDPVPDPVDFGDLVPIMERHHIGALAVIYAAGQSTTAGQKAVKAGLSILEYALTSGGTYDLDSGYADIALIGADGTLLYYEMCPVSTLDLMHDESTEGIFLLIIDHINIAAKGS